MPLELSYCVSLANKSKAIRHCPQIYRRDARVVIHMQYELNKLELKAEPLPPRVTIRKPKVKSTVLAGGAPHDPFLGLSSKP